MHAASLFVVIAACGPTTGTPSADSGAEGSSGSSGTPADGATGSDAAAAGACANATVLIQPGSADAPSGYEHCDDGFIHRVSALACDPAAVAPGDCDPNWGSAQCLADADCGPQGRCVDDPDPSTDCRCNTGCRDDSDCADGQACYCDGNRSTCIDAACLTDADCPATQYCGLAQIVSACGGFSRKLSCTGEADECRVDADCDNECVQCSRVSAQQPWTCNGATGICGPCG
ncbi:MAG: hypothetical protein IPK74_27820 [Deltaproteobacteria bacterium]|nr:hypothetical protein [Deltaproteobacteria bacterium]